MAASVVRKGWYSTYLAYQALGNIELCVRSKKGFRFVQHAIIITTIHHGTSLFRCFFSAVIEHSCPSSRTLQDDCPVYTLLLSGKRYYVICIVFSCTKNQLMDRGRLRTLPLFSIYKWLAVKSPPPHPWFVVFNFNAFQCRCPLCATDKVQKTRIHPTKSKSCAGTKKWARIRTIKPTQWNLSMGGKKWFIVATNSRMTFWAIRLMKSCVLKIWLFFFFFVFFTESFQ